MNTNNKRQNTFEWYKILPTYRQVDHDKINFI